MQVRSDLVLDTNVFIGGLLAPSEFANPQPQRVAQHVQAKAYTHGLATGTYRVHIPRLCLIELCAVIMRELQTKTPQARWLGLKKTFEQWASDGRVVLHGLDEEFMERSFNAAVKYKTRGADTTFVALADELSVPLKTFDGDILSKYSGATLP